MQSLAQLCWLAALAGCSAAEAPPAHITLSLRTDLHLGDELDHVSVEVLQPFDETVLDRGWLVVDTDCQSGEQANRPLGTLQIETGTSRSLRVRVSGFLDPGDGKLSSVVEIQARIPVQPNQTYELFLPRDCVGFSCSSELTCMPESGTCGALPNVPVAKQAVPAAHCASVLTSAPTVDMASPQSVLRCVRSDGLCVAGQGEPCGALATCVAGLVCAQGVCCASDCDGECERCDTPEHPGECTPLDFTASADANNCGACRAQCGSASAFGSVCSLGLCQYQCRDGTADCNGADGAHDGCEQNIEDDPLNCGGCGVMCDIPVCAEQTCATYLGALSAQNPLRMETGTAWGVPIALQKTAILVGLGAALRNTSKPAAHVRLALYEADAYTDPQLLLAQTAEIEVSDFMVAALNPESSLTYGEVAPVTLQPNNYWIVLETDKAVDVMSESLVAEKRLTSPSSGTEPFPTTLDRGRTISAGAEVVLNLVALLVEVHES